MIHWVRGRGGVVFKSISNSFTVLTREISICHSKTEKFVSTRGHVIFSMYYKSSSKDTNNYQSFNWFFVETYPRVSFNFCLLKLGYFSFPVTYKSDSHSIFVSRIFTANKLEKFIYA